MKLCHKVISFSDKKLLDMNHRKIAQANFEILMKHVFCHVETYVIK